MIEEFLREDAKLELCVMIVDARHEPTELDRVMKTWLEQYKVPHQVVATKVDKLSANQLQKCLPRIEKILNCRLVPYSAATGVGKDKLWRVLERI